MKFSQHLHPLECEHTDTTLRYLPFLPDPQSQSCPEEDLRMCLDWKVLKVVWWLITRFSALHNEMHT